MSERPATAVSSPVIFYDGVCGLCDRLTRFVLAHDKRERFRFSALQSPFGVNATSMNALVGGVLFALAAYMAAQSVRAALAPAAVATSEHA